MSPFYFTLLSHYMQAIVASQIDFDKEDVIVMRNLSNMFRIKKFGVIVKPRSFQNQSANKGKEVVHCFVIDGIIQLEQIENMVRSASSQLMGLPTSKVYRYGEAFIDENFWRNVFGAATKVDKYDFMRGIRGQVSDDTATLLVNEIASAIDDYLKNFSELQ